MNKTLRYGLALLGALTLMGAAQAAENQVWLKQTVEGKIFEKGDWSPLRFKVEQEEKFNDERLIDSETLALIGWKMNPYLSVYLGHRWVNERSGGKGPMIAENRPTLDVNLSAPEFWKLKLDARSRFEYRDKHGSTAYMRYRERFRLRTSWSVTDFKISPYVSDELFFSDKPDTKAKDLFDRNRAQIGLSARPIPSIAGLSMNVYYMVQHDWKKDHGWKPTNVFGLELGYSF